MGPPMKITPTILFLLSLGISALSQPNPTSPSGSYYPASPQPYYKGADLSFVKELEGCGVKWKENNENKDIFSIFSSHGANIVRLRIWHTPLSGKNGYIDTDSLISRAKKSGLKVILDFHYSDTWTDPSNQKCPAAWMNVVNNPTALADSLYNYTKNILKTLQSKNLMPEFVQVGNETNGGMCFGGDGVVTWPTDWSKQKLLYNAGIKAVREIDPNCKIILHQADPANTEWWAGELKNNGVTDYDILGISYYPTWHTTKTINDVGTIISNIKQNFQKDVMIVETGLPWSDSWDDNVTNVMNGVPSGYGTSSSPENQAKWLTDLSNKVLSAGGAGIIYWEPDWVASHVAGCVSDFGGSTWENVALFDFNNNLMNDGGIKFLQIGGTNVIENEQNSKKINLSLNLKGQSILHLNFITLQSSEVKLDILTMQGRLIKSTIHNLTLGENDLSVNDVFTQLHSGMYIAKVSSSEFNYVQRFVIGK
jgi:arabinogalactan endo-1,4-beta-galactosidase